MSDDRNEITWKIEQAKVSRYLLDLTSKRGASKAKYLMRFGFTDGNPLMLANALVVHAVTHWPGSYSVSKWGNPVVVFEGMVQAPDGRAMPLRTVWEPREPLEMHFVTAVPLTR